MNAADAGEEADCDQHTTNELDPSGYFISGGSGHPSLAASVGIHKSSAFHASRT